MTAISRWLLWNHFHKSAAVTSDGVAILDCVGPNPLPCVGEGITFIIPANAGIRPGDAGSHQIVVVLCPPMKAKLGKSVSAALTVPLFAMAAAHNDDLFWEGSSIVSALRVEDQSWQRFYAGFHD